MQNTQTQVQLDCSFVIVKRGPQVEIGVVADSSRTLFEWWWTLLFSRGEHRSLWCTGVAVHRAQGDVLSRPAFVTHPPAATACATTALCCETHCHVTVGAVSLRHACCLATLWCEWDRVLRGIAAAPAHCSSHHHNIWWCLLIQRPTVGSVSVVTQRLLQTAVTMVTLHATLLLYILQCALEGAHDPQLWGGEWVVDGKAGAKHKSTHRLGYRCGASTPTHTN